MNAFRHRLLISLLSLISVTLLVIASPLKVTAKGTADCLRSNEFIRAGILEIYTGDVEKALEIFEKTTSKCRKNYQIIYNMAVAHGMAGNFGKMSEYLKRALYRKGEFPLGRVNLTWSLINEGKYIEAEKVLSALERKEEGTRVLLLRAFLNLYQNNRSEFNRLRKEAVRKGRGERAEILIYLNQIRAETGRTRFTRKRGSALDLDYGRYYEKIGDYKRAEEYYLNSGKRVGIIRLISLLKTTLGADAKIQEYKNSLLGWSGVVTPELKRVFNYNVRGAYPEGVLSFIYPEDLVEVPEGPFKIGRPGASHSDKNHFWNHNVYTDRFLIGKYEVSNVEYLLFIDSTGYPSPYNTHNSNYDLWEGGRFKPAIAFQPIVNVSWYDVTKYLAWKGSLTGDTYKLPTEERWEKAARGEDGRIFPWGNGEPSPELANYGKNWNDFEKKFTTLKDVDSYKEGQSPYGLLNMAGNVWEWTSSTHHSFFYDDPTLAVERLDVPENELKVIRGGSWINKPGELVSTWRNRNWPYVKYNGIGFRVVRE